MGGGVLQPIPGLLILLNQLGQGAVFRNGLLAQLHHIGDQIHVAYNHLSKSLTIPEDIFWDGELYFFILPFLGDEWRIRILVIFLMIAVILVDISMYQKDKSAANS